MNRRNFLKFIGIASVGVTLIKQLPSITESNSVVWPNTSYELEDIFTIQWTGLKSDPLSNKLVGHWLAYPKKKCLNIQGTYVQSTVICYDDDHYEVKNEDIQNGLNILLEIIERGINIAKTHGIEGCIPISGNGNIDRSLLSVMRRDHIKLGIWPN